MGTATVITSDAITDLEDDITELTTKLNGVIIQYNKVQADMSLNKLAIDALKTQFNIAESDLTNHTGKIDTLIADVTTGTNNHKGRIDILIDDVGDINDKISAGYTASGGDAGGATTDSILTRIQRLDEDFTELEKDFEIHKENSYTTQHSQTYGTGRSAGGVADTPGELYALADDLEVGSSDAASGSSSGTATDGSAAITAATRDDSILTDEHDIITPSYSTGAAKVITIGAKGEIRGKRLSRQTLNRLRK